MQELAKSDFKILLVENSRTTRAVLTSMLKRQGYSIDAVANGKDAIDSIRDGAFHLVLMDLYMPMLNGYEASKEIRELPEPQNNVPIIAITASTDNTDIEICKKAGMNEYFMKAMGEEELLKLIEKYREKYAH